MTMYHLEFAQRVGLLRQNKSFRNFWLARLLSFFGDTLAKVALTIYASRLEGGATLVGWLLVAHTLPWLLGPLAGVVADHSEQRRLMVLCEIGQGMLFIGITLSLSSFPMVLILIFLATMLATLFSPSGNSALPLIVRAEDISIANALLGFSYNLGYALGPVVAGLLVLWWDVQVVLMLNCLTFVFSVVLLLKLPPLSTASSLTISQVWTSFREGLSYTFNHKTTRAVTLGLFAVVVFGALDNVALVFFSSRCLERE